MVFVDVPLSGLNHVHVIESNMFLLKATIMVVVGWL